MEQDLNREQIKFMRDDGAGGGITDSAGGIVHYIHSNYEDIEPVYRDMVRDDIEAGAEAIREGSPEEPADWPAFAVESGFAEDEADYYDPLNEAAVHAAREEAHERASAPDQMLKYSIRAMDDQSTISNVAHYDTGKGKGVFTFNLTA